MASLPGRTHRVQARDREPGGLGRYREPLAAARQASEHKHPYVSVWALPELVAAAVHTGETSIARDALDLLAEPTRAGGTEEGLGVRRGVALLSDGDAAEACYHEAIRRLGPTRLRPEFARAHLLYGEWLRRERRRGEAREQLRTYGPVPPEQGVRQARHQLARPAALGAARRAALAALSGTRLTSVCTRCRPPWPAPGSILPSLRLQSRYRSCSLVPPQTPCTCRVRSVNARHCVRTGHRAQIFFASATCLKDRPDDETGKNRSGSQDRQAAADRQCLSSAATPMPRASRPDADRCRRPRRGRQLPPPSPRRRRSPRH